MKKFKNNITYKDTTGRTKRVNFKTTTKMTQYLEKNKIQLNKLSNVRVNFGVVSIPIRETIWNG